MFFRTKKSLVRMRDKIEIEGRKGNEQYLTTSNLNGEDKCILGRYEREQRALEILDRIDKILDEAIKENRNTVSINIPSE